MLFEGETRAFRKSLESVQTIALSLPYTGLIYFLDLLIHSYLYCADPYTVHSAVDLVYYSIAHRSVCSRSFEGDRSQGHVCRMGKQGDGLRVW